MCSWFVVHQDYFEDLVKFMSSGPSHVLVLTKGQTDDSIIKDWRDMLGPPAVEDAQEQAPDRYVGVFLSFLVHLHLAFHSGEDFILPQQGKKPWDIHWGTWQLSSIGLLI